MGQQIVLPTFTQELIAELRADRATLRRALAVLSRIPLAQHEAIGPAIAMIHIRLEHLATFNLGE